MREVLVALAVGVAVGGVFALARSVPPAPATWAGVAGIVGIVAGWQIVARLLGTGS